LRVPPACSLSLISKDAYMTNYEDGMVDAKAQSVLPAD